MDAEKKHSLSGFERLPNELKQMILALLGDLYSLRSAVLTGPATLTAFMGNEVAITTPIAWMEMTKTSLKLDVMAEATIALASRRLQPSSDEDIYQFASENLQWHDIASTTWTLGNATYFFNLYACVQRFTASYLESMGSLPRSRRRYALEAQSAPTRSEHTRIERAFYRFEIFCNLHRGCKAYQKEPSQVLRRAFMRRFIHYENEQLGCIHDFLVTKIYPVFLDVASHDVIWGSYKIPYKYDLGSPFIQEILSQGLQCIWHIQAAQTFSKRYEMLGNGARPKSTSNFLFEALSDPALDPTNSVTPRVWARRIFASRQIPPFYNDPTGPWLRWNHHHSSVFPWPFAYQADKATLRQQGWVMWDINRPLPKLHQPATPVNKPEDISSSDMEASWAERSKILESGGTGWWSANDCSRIFWNDISADVD